MKITAEELAALNAPGPSQAHFSSLNIRDYLAELKDDELYNEFALAHERGIGTQEQMRRDIPHKQRAYLLADMEAAIEMRAETVFELTRRNLPVP